MTIHIDIQKVDESDLKIQDSELIKWAKTPLEHFDETGELTLRICSKDEIHQLNHTYRHKNKATNVLAFPTEVPENIPLDFKFWGDVIICPDVINDEAKEMNKNLTAHWAHIIIHGVLHLMGYDHIKDDDAKEMQDIEVEILRQFNIDNPYSDEDIA